MMFSPNEKYFLFKKVAVLILYGNKVVSSQVD